jgi:ABC-2 type transport system permease protein
MSLALWRKILRDLRWPLFFVGLLLFAFQTLWAKVTDRVVAELLPAFAKQKVPVDLIAKILFQGPGKIIQTIMGGEMIHLNNPMEMLTIAYVHPLTQVILCVWAIGRAAGAFAGEIDKGTMELLMAQPVSRRRVVLSHLAVDAVVIPMLCLAIFSGTTFGAWVIDLAGIDLSNFVGALANVAALLFAVGGYTMALSAMGRQRWKVMSVALGFTLVQFLVNLLGQLWDVLEPWRPLTVFYYYQPQSIILHQKWTVSVASWWPAGEVNVIGVLFLVGAMGYVVAYATFTERDLPAPL